VLEAGYGARVEEIAVGDRRVIELGEPIVGGSKNNARFGRVGQERVVVKVQGTYGRLREEEEALRFLAGHGVCVPRVVDSGVIEDGGRFLAVSQDVGAPSLTAEGWTRCGHDFAGLIDVPIQACPFPRVTTADFVADHRERLDLVRSLLEDDVVQAISSAIAQIAGTGRLVVTHGDPGGGNYLDNPSGRGVLLDWETASVSPLGLDLGRAAFIGLLDLWQTGIPEELSSAFIHGYTSRSATAGELRGDLLHAWIIIGGLQFIHGRYTQPLMPERTPQVAARILENYLAS
jgi:hypothetical protein